MIFHISDLKGSSLQVPFWRTFHVLMGTDQTLQEKFQEAVLFESGLLEPVFSNVEEVDRNLEQQSPPENQTGPEDDVTELRQGEVLRDTGWKVRPFSQVEFVRNRKSYVFDGDRLRARGSQKTNDSGNETNPTSSHTPVSCSVRLDHRDVQRWRMAWRMRVAMPSELASIETRITPPHWFRSHTPDFADMDSILDVGRIGVGFSAAAFVYGGLHALAWQAHFETHAQQLLWRISSCVTMGGLPAIYTLNSLDTIVNESHYDAKFLSWTVFSLGVVLFIAYMLARAYLVVECFMQLFNLPAGVFDIPQWTAYFPHIS